MSLNPVPVAISFRAAFFQIPAHAVGFRAGSQGRPFVSQCSGGKVFRNDSFICLKRRQLQLAWKDRIAVDPDVLAGKPVIKGTRIAVEFVVGLLADGWTYEMVLNNYPQLKKEDILAALSYASEVLKEERVFPLA